jgi:hypothetical protein
MDRIEQIREAAREYGKHSIENMQMGETLGREIMAAFDTYLTPKGGLVIGVPPIGSWEHDKGDYRDAAFSYYHEPLLTVSQTQFGIGVHILDNLWVRLVVTLRKQGDRIGVFCGHGNNEALWIPEKGSAADIGRVCERLFQTLLGYYRGDVNVFVYGDEKMLTIGFVPPRTKPK